MTSTTEIKRRYAKGQHHKAEWINNSARAIADEYGIKAGTLQEALSKGRKCRDITQEQFEDAQRRVEYGRKHQHLYYKHSSRTICKEFRIGDRTLHEIVEDSMAADDPVRRFLTMRLVA